jgi:hypothetical protein
VSIGSNGENSYVPAGTADSCFTLLPLTAEEISKVRNNLAKLRAEDRQLAEAQVWCVIDQESALGINGPPQTGFSTYREANAVLAALGSRRRSR